MFDVIIKNGNIPRTIHDHRAARNSQKLDSGEIVDGVNAISSFTFTINPANAGYDALNEYTTFVTVRNTKRGRDDFVGRVLQITPEMDSNGMMQKTVVCEDRLGYLQDSIQPYTPEKHYQGDETRTGLEEFIDVLLANHNERVEEYKRIYRGEVTVQPFDSSDSVYKGLNWQTTYDCITDKLLKSYGGYIRLRETAGVLYLDYLASIGTTRTTTIEVARNMVSASKDIDSSGIITRLTPLGAKLTALDANGNETQTEERLTIASINDGLDYIEAQTYLAKYGIRCQTVTFDDVTDPQNLLSKGTAYLAETNGMSVSHDIEAIDLSLLGLDIDDFVVYDSYPVKNPAIGIDDVLQIVKKNTDVVEPYNSSFEMGDKLKRLSDAVLDFETELENTKGEIKDIVNSEVKNQTNVIYTFVNESISAIKQDSDMIWAAVEDRAVAKSEYETFAEIVRNILRMEADGTTMIFQTINEAIKQVGDVEASHRAELLTYIRFSESGIEIGKEGNAITMQLDNDSLDFYNNGTRVAYISDNMLYITDGRFLRSVRIGNYGFIPESNGSVSFAYLGGE